MPDLPVPCTQDEIEHPNHAEPRAELPSAPDRCIHVRNASCNLSLQMLAITTVYSLRVAAESLPPQRLHCSDEW